MKSTITLLCSFVFAISLTAQNLSLNITSTHIEMNELLDFGEILLTNNGTQAIEVALTFEKSCSIEGDPTAIQICFGDLCFIPTNQTTTWGDTGDAILNLEPGATFDLFKFEPYGAEQVGSEWHLEFWDRNNPTDRQVLDVVLGVCAPVGVDNIVHEVGQAFPNPATTNITISTLSREANTSLIVYNVMGFEMERIILSAASEQVTIDVADYKKGVYFYQMSDGKGGYSQTRSFVK